MINLKFEPNKQDYVKIVRARLMSSFKQPRLWILLIAVNALFFGQGVISLTEGDAQGGVPFLILPALIGGLLFGTFWFVLPIRSGNQAQRGGERTLGETHWQLDDEQILIKNKFAETRFDWGTFREIVEIEDHYLLVHSVNKNLLHFIPKRAFESPEQERAFCELVRRNIKPQDKSVGIRDRIVLLIVIVLGLMIVACPFLIYAFYFK